MKLVSLVLEIEVRKHLLNNFPTAAGAKACIRKRNYTLYTRTSDRLVKVNST